MKKHRSALLITRDTVPPFAVRLTPCDVIETLKESHTAIVEIPLREGAKVTKCVGFSDLATTRERALEKWAEFIAEILPQAAGTAEKSAANETAGATPVA